MLPNWVCIASEPRRSRLLGSQDVLQQLGGGLPVTRDRGAIVQLGNADVAGRDGAAVPPVRELFPHVLEGHAVGPSGILFILRDHPVSVRRTPEPGLAPIPGMGAGRPQVL